MFSLAKTAQDILYKKGKKLLKYTSFPQESAIYTITADT